ncbi:glycine cleavage system protein H [bacterium]|nr:glycine cleavage system protein H [bacterium]
MVAYKICDRNFQCETCPLDIGLRGGSESAEGSMITAMNRPEGVHPLRIALMSQMVQPLRWANRFFHPRHFWLQMLDQDRIRIGIDLIAASILGSIEGITLPEEGKRIERDAVCGGFIKGGRQFGIVSPITGVVIAVNESLTSWPNRLHLDPMEEGWLFEVRPEALHGELAHYRRGGKTWSWYVNEILKLDNRLARQLPEQALTQIDEDSLAEELQKSISEAAYTKLVQDIIGGGDSDEQESDQG